MKILIRIADDNDSLIEKAECGSFESAGESLGKMERRWEDEQKSPVREAYEENPERIETKDNVNQNERD